MEPGQLRRSNSYLHCGFESNMGFHLSVLNYDDFQPHSSLAKKLEGTGKRFRDKLKIQGIGKSRTGRLVQRVSSVPSNGSIRGIHSGATRLRSGLYSYRFDSHTARSCGFTLTVVGGNE